MDLSIQQLRMLREVSVRGTIAAAAQSLGYTPSAVSQQLSGLEKATGVAVLERVGRNVRLTDAGRVLVRHADDLLASLEAARAAMERTAEDATGTVEISMYESVAATLLVPALERLAEQHPDLVVRSRQLDKDEAIDAVANGDVDLAFSLDYPNAIGALRPGLSSEDVFHDAFHVVVPADDPLQGPVVALADLADRPIIAPPFTGACGFCVAVACRASGFEPNVVHTIDSYPTVLRLVAAGAGTALLPTLALVDPPAGVRVLEVDPPFHRTIQMIYRTASADRPAISAVRAAFVAAVRGLDL